MKKLVCVMMILALCLPLTACFAEGDSSLPEQFAISGVLEGLFDWDRLGEYLENIPALLNPPSDESDVSQSVGVYDPPAGENDVSQSVGVSDTPVISATEELIMPDLVDVDIYAAREWLDARGVSYETSYEFHSVYAEDRIISQSISSGTFLSGDELLTLAVSKGAEECPYPYSQKLVVTAASGSSYATASLYEWSDGDWKLLVTYNATVGSNGIGQAYEGSKRTPQGMFKLGVILSANSLNTNMNTYYASNSTCVVDDPDSRYYNCIMELDDVPSGASYDRIGKGLNDGRHYAFMYIEHNGTGLSPEGVISGAGSVMGVRGTYMELGPTFGDVDISYRDMQDLLSRLDSAKNPMIEIIAE